MSSSAHNPMAEGRKGLSDGAIAAIAVTVSVGTVIALLSLYLFLYYRKKQQRASLEAIGAQNLYSTPKSARRSQIVVTREVSSSISRLPSTNSYIGGRTLRGSYRSESGKPLLRESYQSTTSPTPSRQPPPRPARPSWPASVLDANTNVDFTSLQSCAPLSKPVQIYSSTSPVPRPVSPTFFDPEVASPAGTGQIVNTYRHPTPTLSEQEDFMTVRQRVEVERCLGANPGMTDIGFRREHYTMYDENEDLSRESWRDISSGVVLSDEARETAEWTRVCDEEVGRAL